MPLLTVVSKKNPTDPASPAKARTAESASVVRTARRAEHLGPLPKPQRNDGDLKAMLDSVGPLLVKIMRAERGFIRLFSQDDQGGHEDVGVAGLNAGDSIGITETAYLQRLMAGRFVRDGSTLLVPLLSDSHTVGFCCLDRRRPLPFTDEDGHFLMGIGQAAMTLTAHDPP
jgi:hypothetical protein